MRRAGSIRLAIGALALATVVIPAQGQPSGPAISVSGAVAHLDGRPAFLTGVSVFDALGTVAPRDADLDALKSWGVNTVRVWAHWHEPIYQSDGTLTAGGQARLLALVRRLQSRGLILELVLLRPGQLPGQPFPVFASEAARARAVEAVTLALRPFRNVLFDLYNEHDHPDGPITHAAARALRDKVKAIDGGRLVTISSTEYHLVSPPGEIDDARARNVREEASHDAGSVAVDMVAPHFPRTEDWAAATATRIRAVRGVLDRIGSHVPIYLSEERRADGSARIQPSAYQLALANARSAGAAGWVFHTAAGFELKKTAFLDALATEERAALQTLQR